MSEGKQGEGGDSSRESGLWRQIQDIRDSIDNLDAVLVHVLAERFKATGRIGELKAAYGVPAQDLRRHAEQAGRLHEVAERAGIEPDVVLAVMHVITVEVIRRHQAVAQCRGQRPD